MCAIEVSYDLNVNMSARQNRVWKFNREHTQTHMNYEDNKLLKLVMEKHQSGLSCNKMSIFEQPVEPH